MSASAYAASAMVAGEEAMEEGGSVAVVCVSDCVRDSKEKGG